MGKSEYYTYQWYAYQETSSMHGHTQYMYIIV